MLGNISTDPTVFRLHPFLSECALHISEGGADQNNPRWLRIEAPDSSLSLATRISTVDPIYYKQNIKRSHVAVVIDIQGMFAPASIDFIVQRSSTVGIDVINENEHV